MKRGGSSLTEPTFFSNLSGLIYRKGNFNGDLIIELQRAEQFTGTQPLFDNNISKLNLGEVNYPYYFSFANLVQTNFTAFVHL